MLENLPININGHLLVEDTTDLDNRITLIDKRNSVHPQNLARAFARALANESNFWIESMAFGNGGTFINVTQNIQYRTVNDGQSPDTNSWNSRLYNETYREIVQEGNPTLNPSLGLDVGSADAATGTRPGGGSEAISDPLSIPHVSGPGVRSSELGLTSEVIVTCVLNPNEPKGQFNSDQNAPIENPGSSFMFDEIALFTSGAPALATSGIHDIDIGDRTAKDDTGLTANTIYDFNIAVNGGAVKVIQFTTPVSGGSGTGGEILYGDLVKALRTGLATWNITVDAVPVIGVNPLPNNTTINITNDGTFDLLIPAIQTYGFLRFISGTSGASSRVIVTAGSTNNLISALNPPTGGTFKTPIIGQAQGIQNNPIAATTERERMLTHVLFSPVLKSMNRTLTISYTLTISVARTV